MNGTSLRTVTETHPSAQPESGRSALETVIGLSAISFSMIYLASDVIEVMQGVFSTFRLSLTYAGEAAIPMFVLGLYALQRPRIGLAGLFGAIAYAYSYVFFTSTVAYAIVETTPDGMGAAVLRSKQPRLIPTT